MHNPADSKVKMKKSEKRDQYLDLARELKELWNKKVTVVPIIVCALGTIHKGLVKELEDLEIRGQVKTIRSMALLKSAKILRSFGDLRRLAVSQTPVKNRQLILV